MMVVLAQQASPMSMLRTSVSAASTYDPDGWDESSEAQYRKAMRLVAMTPTLIATYHRLRTGQKVLEPKPFARGQLPLVAAGTRARRRRCQGFGHDVRAVCRSHDERLDLHRKDHRLDACRHVQRDHGRDRRAQRPATWGRKRGVDEDAPRSRRACASGGVCEEPARATREDHGVRPRRLQDDGSAGDRPQESSPRRPATRPTTSAGSRSPRRSRERSWNRRA